MITFDPFSRPISDNLFDKLNGIALRRCVEDFIEYLINETTSIQEIDNAMFDFIARFYVYHLGKVYYRIAYFPIGIILKSSWRALSKGKNYRETVLSIYDDKVPPLLNSSAKAIIDVLQELQFPSDYCESLRNRYCLSTIVDYSKIEIPNDYPIRYEKDPNILCGVVTYSREEFKERLNKMYGSYNWSKGFYTWYKIGEADVDKIFYNRYENIFNTIFSLND